MTKTKFAARFFAYPAVALLSLAAALSAHADGALPTDVSFGPVQQSNLTRAQVRADLLQSRADGAIQTFSAEYDPLAAQQANAQWQSTRTRAQVQAEARAAGGARYDTAMYGEDSGSFYLSQRPAQRDASRLLASNKR